MKTTAIVADTVGSSRSWILESFKKKTSLLAFSIMEKFAIEIADSNLPKNALKNFICGLRIDFDVRL